MKSSLRAEFIYFFLYSFVIILYINQHDDTMSHVNFFYKYVSVFRFDHITGEARSYISNETPPHFVFKIDY